MRRRLPIIAELLGFTLLTAGAAAVAIPLGLVVAGAALLILGYALGSNE